MTKEEKKAYNRAYMKEYSKRPEVIARRKKILKKYRNSPKGKKTRGLTQKSYLLAKRYGLTVEDLAKLLEVANNSCQICDKAFSGKLRPCIDHDHITGKVRGILCSTCNSALGFLKDDINLTKKAVKYLENSI
jgi:hypothetical protein